MFAEVGRRQGHDRDARDAHQGARARRRRSRRSTPARDADAIAAAVGEHGATKLFVIDPGDGLPGPGRGGGDRAARGRAQPRRRSCSRRRYDGRDAIARLSVKLDRPVLTNGMSLSADGGLMFGTAIFGGVTLVDAKLTGGGPALIAIRPKSFAAEQSGGGAAEVVERRRGRRRPRGRGQGARAPRRGAAGPEARRGDGRRVGRARHRRGRELRAARRGARQAAQGRVGRVACDRRRRAGCRTRCRSARPARP